MDQEREVSLMFDLLFHEDQSSLCGKMRIFVQSEVRAIARWTVFKNMGNAIRIEISVNYDFFWITTILDAFSFFAKKQRKFPNIIQSKQRKFNNKTSK